MWSANKYNWDGFAILDYQVASWWRYIQLKAEVIYRFLDIPTEFHVMSRTRSTGANSKHLEQQQAHGLSIFLFCMRLDASSGLPDMYALA